MKKFVKRTVVAVPASIALILLVLLAWIALKPGEYRVERSLEILASSDAIYSRISELPEWEKWSPWKAKDATMKISYEGPRGGVGAIQNWKSQTSGEGSLRITDAVQNQKVRYLLTFKDWSSKSEGEILLEPIAGATTRVRWVMEGKNDFMGKLFWMLFGFERSINEDFDQGLAGIKRLVEQHASAVSDQALPDQPSEGATASAH